MFANEPTPAPLRGRGRLWPLGTLVALLALLVGLAGAASGCKGTAEPPRSVVQRLQAAVKQRHYGSVYDLLSAEAQIRIDAAMQTIVANLKDEDDGLKLLGAPKSKLADAGGRELFERLFATPSPDQRSWQASEDLPAAVIDAERSVSANRVAIVLKWPSGRTLEIELLLESGAWRIDRPALW